MDILQEWARARTQVAREIAQSSVAVQVHPRGRVVSGIVWKSDTVVTAAESICDDKALVIGADGSFEAKVLAADLATDVAVLRVPGFPGTSEPAQSNGVVAGQPVVLAGRRPDAGTAAPVIRWCDVQSVGASWHSRRGARISARIELALRLHPAMEGAGVYDIDGALCAMAVAGPRGKTLAIPVETIAHVAKKVLAAGYLAHPFIGVRLAQVWLDEEQRTEFGHDRGEAILVTGVERDSPAMQSGLAFGDVILRAGDRSIHSPAGLAREIRAADLGASLRLEIRRGGSPRTLDVIVGERPRH